MPHKSERIYAGNRIVLDIDIGIDPPGESDGVSLEKAMDPINLSPFRFDLERLQRLFSFALA